MTKMLTIAQAMRSLKPGYFITKLLVSNGRASYG